MATQKEIKEWLKSVNLKKTDIDKMWNELAEIGYHYAVNSKVHKWLWEKLHISAIPDIIGLKERFLEAKAKKEERLKKEREQKEEAKRIASLDTRTTEQKLLDRIIAKEELSDRELSNLIDMEVDR